MDNKNMDRHSHEDPISPDNSQAKTNRRGFLKKHLLPLAVAGASFSSGSRYAHNSLNEESNKTDTQRQQEAYISFFVKESETLYHIDRAAILKAIETLKKEPAGAKINIESKEKKQYEMVKDKNGEFNIRLVSNYIPIA
jgi:uncharacterized protein YegP (UPF0339 family)